MSTPLAADQRRFSVGAVFCGKAGNSPEEYEDAFSARGADPAYRVAIADGATESSYSGFWARLLVESYTRRKEGHGPEFLGQIEAARRLLHRRAKRPHLAWYAAEKARQGAFAAFLGLELYAGTKTWRALAVGDCCLFHLDRARTEMRLLTAFPLTRSLEFGSTPFLVGSNSAEPLEAHVRVAQGSLRAGDVLLLATDAVSAWFLWRQEQERPVWSQVASDIHDNSDFEKLVEEARGEGLRNDDMTLVRIVCLG